MTRRVVATIMPGRTLDAALAAMRGMSKCYPPHTLSLTNDTATGGMVIIYDPDAPPPAKGKGSRPRRQVTEDDGPNAEIAIGTEEAGELIAYAFHPETATEDGVKAITAWMSHLLDTTEGAANYVTFTLEHPGGKRYGLTVQRVEGMTPAEKIARLAEDNTVLARVGRMYLDALDADPDSEALTLPEAILATDVRDAVERAEGVGEPYDNGGRLCYAYGGTDGGRVRVCDKPRWHRDSCTYEYTDVIETRRS